MIFKLFMLICQILLLWVCMLQLQCTVFQASTSTRSMMTLISHQARSPSRRKAAQGNVLLLLLLSPFFMIIIIYFHHNHHHNHNHYHHNHHHHHHHHYHHHHYHHHHHHHNFHHHHNHHNHHHHHFYDFDNFITTLYWGNRKLTSFICSFRGHNGVRSVISCMKTDVSLLACLFYFVKLPLWWHYENYVKWKYIGSGIKHGYKNI